MVSESTKAFRRLETILNQAMIGVLMVAFTTVSSSCSHLAGVRDEQPQLTEVRDVPYTARDGDFLRHRVLVLPFLEERHNQAITEVARQTLVRELLKTGQFVIVSLSDFPQDPKKFLTEENEYDLTQISRQAAAMGVAAVIEGKILSFRAKRIGDSMGLLRELKARVSAEVRVRVYAGKNGKEILNEVRSADTETSSTRIAERGDILNSLSEEPELIRAAIRKGFVGALPNIMRAIEKLSWEGRVAMVSGERVYINAGQLSGIQVGDILKITEEGEEIYDPETGRFIGSAVGRLKGTVEVVSYFGKDGSVAVIHSGSGFQENDRVELY